MSAWELIGASLRHSGFEGVEAVHMADWMDCAKDFDAKHFLRGFGYPDEIFRFAPVLNHFGANARRVA